MEDWTPHVEKTPWRKLLGENSVEKTPWRKLLGENSVEKTPWRKLLGENFIPGEDGKCDKTKHHN